MRNQCVPSHRASDVDSGLDYPVGHQGRPMVISQMRVRTLAHTPGESTPVCPAAARHTPTNDAPWHPPARMQVGIAYAGYSGSSTVIAGPPGASWAPGHPP
jgi:hypothetical protein